MPQALAHFAVGMALTTIVLTILWPAVRYPRLLVICGGIWAMLPDIHWIVPGMRPWKPLYHDHLLANVFWFHQILDTRFDPGDTDLFAVLALLFMAAVTLWAERRAYRSPSALTSEE